MLLNDGRRGRNPLVMCFLLTLALLLITDVAGATYKKPPFNGSIFGKRSNGIPDYEGAAGRTLSTLCGIAFEACSAWFPQVETKKK